MERERERKGKRKRERERRKERCGDARQGAGASGHTRLPHSPPRRAAARPRTRASPSTAGPVRPHVASRRRARRSAGRCSTAMASMSVRFQQQRTRRRALPVLQPSPSTLVPPLPDAWQAKQYFEAAHAIDNTFNIPRVGRRVAPIILAFCPHRLLPSHPSSCVVQEAVETLSKLLKPPSTSGNSFTPLSPRTRDGRTLTPMVDSDGHVSIPVRTEERATYCRFCSRLLMFTTNPLSRRVTLTTWRHHRRGQRAGSCPIRLRVRHCCG